MNTVMEHFEQILTAAVVLCFVFYLLDGRSYRKTRKHLYKVLRNGKASDTDRNAYADRLMTASSAGIRKKHKAAWKSAQTQLNTRNPLRGNELYWARRPVYAKEKVYEFFGGMFWVLFAVWFMRSFLWEPFQIPSASMEPTLQNGDFILASKYAYTIRWPVLHKKIISLGEVAHGDVIVFRYPREPKINYIKRVIGIPGDHIRFDHGRVWVNGKMAVLTAINEEHIGHDDHLPYLVYHEDLPGHAHRVLFAADIRRNIPFSGAFTVPPGKYFAMGDNRDNSSDSRVWGFVPEENLVGKALFIWMNSDCLIGKGFCKRIGKAIE